MRLISKFIFFLFLSIVESCYFNTANRQNNQNSEIISKISAQEIEIPMKKSHLNLDDRKKWKDIIKWDNDCPNEEIDSEDYNGGLKFYDLSTNTFLVEVKCSSGGYAGFRRYFFYNESKSPASSKLLKFKYYRGSSPDPKKDVKILGREEIERLQNILPTKMFTVDESLIFERVVFDSLNKSLIIFDTTQSPYQCGTVNKYSFENGIANLYEIRGNWLCVLKETDPLTWKTIDLKKLKRISKKIVERYQ